MGQRNMAFLPAIPKVSMSTRGYQGFMNVLLMRVAHQIGKGTSKDTKKTNYPMTPQRHRFLIDFQKIFLDFCAKRIDINGIA